MARTSVQPTPAGVAGLASDELSTEEQSQLDQMRDEPDSAAEPAAAEPGEPGEPAAEPAADGRPRMVPHAALHEERLRRQATEKDLADARKERQTLEERTNLLLQRMQPAAQPTQQQATAEIPDVATDPVGHIVAKMNQQQGVIEQLVQAYVGAAQQQQMAQAGATIQQRAQALEAEFRAATPEYDAGAAFLADARNRELIAAGWSDPAERRTLISQEAFGLAQRAIQNNRNPAEVVLELAKIRGFAPAAAGGDGAGAPAAANAGQRIANAAAGQRQAGTSLSNTRGGGAPAPMDAQRLVNMDAAEFTDFLDKASPAQLRAALGE